MYSKFILNKFKVNKLKVNLYHKKYTLKCLSHLLPSLLLYILSCKVYISFIVLGEFL